MECVSTAGPEDQFVMAISLEQAIVSGDLGPRPWGDLGKLGNQVDGIDDRGIQGAEARSPGSPGGPVESIIIDELFGSLL